MITTRTRMQSVPTFETVGDQMLDTVYTSGIALAPTFFSEISADDLRGVAADLEAKDSRPNVVRQVPFGTVCAAAPELYDLRTYMAEAAGFTRVAAGIFRRQAGIPHRPQNAHIDKMPLYTGLTALAVVSGGDAHITAADAPYVLTRRMVETGVIPLEQTPEYMSVYGLRGLLLIRQRIELPDGRILPRKYHAGFCGVDRLMISIDFFSGEPNFNFRNYSSDQLPTIQ